MTEELLASARVFFERDAGRVLRDLIDIGLVALVLYWVLKLIRGTRAMQMAVGLALVFVVHQASRELGFVTVWRILDTLLTYIVLIIVILFQNDIRRALMRVGRRPFLKSQRTARETHVIEEVVKASTALAQKRIGALIVFERDAMLDEFIEPGTEVDSAVTKELLYGIFIPSFENPMHDGAVIIREGRVWHAGAFLPMTAHPQLDRTLGARHRAAIGISEETDAVVVAVSEERGSVSLCFNGNIVRNLDEKSLREALMGLFYKKRKHRQKKKAAAAARAQVATRSASREPAPDDPRDVPSISPPRSTGTASTGTAPTGTASSSTSGAESATGSTGSKAVSSSAVGNAEEGSR